MLLDRVVDVSVVLVLLLFEEERRGLEAASDEEVGGDCSVDDVLVVIFGDNALLCMIIQ